MALFVQKLVCLATGLSTEGLVKLTPGKVRVFYICFNLFFHLQFETIQETFIMVVGNEMVMTKTKNLCQCPSSNCSLENSSS